MRKTPSYLKGLAETRARASADVVRLQRIHEEITQRLAEAEAELDACDRLIRKYDSRLDPGTIKPIAGWQNRYGKRGALRASLIRHLQKAFPNALGTGELMWAVELEFKLDFITPGERGHWRHNSLGRALNVLVVDGIVERMHDVTNGTNSGVGRWRWKGDSSLSLDHLHALAAAAGVATQQADVDHE